MIARIEFRAMGCRVEAQVDLPARQPAPPALSQLPQLFENWEARLSRFRPDSELNRLNRAQGEAMPVSAALWQTLQAAIRAEASSDGLVSAAVLDALLAAGYTESFERIAARGVVESPPPSDMGREVFSPARRLSAIEMDAESHSVRLPEGMRLDLGGVAKGWAAHQAMRRLETFGPALVNAGGDLAISGRQRSGEAWPISIDDPRCSGGSLGKMRVGRGGVATSGIDYRRWRQAGREQHHIIDPRSGRPAQTDVLAVTVVAPSVMEAEMAAKTVLILGSRAGMAWLESRPHCAGLLALQDGRLASTSALRSLEFDGMDLPDCRRMG